MNLARRPRRLVVFLASLALMATACGGADSSAEVIATDGPAEEPAATSAEGTSGGGETFELRLAHATSDQSPYGVMAAWLDSAMQEATDGRVSVKQFANGTLGNDATILDLYGTGDIDLGISSTIGVSEAHPEFRILEIPFLWESKEHWYSVMREGGMDHFAQVIEDDGADYEIAAFSLFGVRSIYTRGLKIEEAADLEGLKLRNPTDPIAMKSWSELGVVPTSVPWGELYSALEQGVVDAASNDPVWYIDAKHYEVAPVFNTTEHEWGTTFLMVGDPVWDKLPEDLHDPVRQVLEQTTDEWLDITDELSQASWDQMQELEGVEINEVSDQVLSDLASRLEGVRSEIAAEQGLEEFMADVEAARNG